MKLSSTQYSSCTSELRVGCLIRRPCSLHSTETMQRMNPERKKKTSRFVPGYLICQMLARVGDTTAAGGGIKRTIKTVLKGACPRGGDSYHPMWPSTNYRGSWHRAAGFPKQSGGQSLQLQQLLLFGTSSQSGFRGQTRCQCSVLGLKPSSVLIMNSLYLQFKSPWV